MFRFNKKTKVFQVSLVLEDNSAFGYVNYNENIKMYAFLTNENEADKLVNKLNELGHKKLKKLKVLKSGEIFMKAVKSIPLRLDNFDNIWKKLNKGLDNEKSSN